MPLPKILLTLQAIIFGLIVGSFLNVCIYRIPKKISLLGRSFCPHCTVPIPFYRNIPVLSYVLQLGKSTCCGRQIPQRYPLVEIATALISAVTIFHATTLTQYLLWFLLFMCPLIVISVIDFQLKIIPDTLSLPFIGVGVLVSLYEGSPDLAAALLKSTLGIFVGAGALLLIALAVSKLKRTEAMGGGDIKLTAMLGAFLGLKGLLFVFLASSLFGLVYFLLSMPLRKGDKTIPFGPFLSLGGMVYWLYGRGLTSWYFMRMGVSTNPFFE